MRKVPLRLPALSVDYGHEHADHNNFAVVLVGIEHHTVDAAFPRLIPGLVPPGVLEAKYEIALPPSPGAVPDGGHV
jgi:hypothetical protein